jgi:hypothetical protein
MAIDLTRETVASNVISQLASAVVKLSTIAKICKYKGLHEMHHFILMAMDVHSAFGRDMDCFVREHAHLFHNRRSRGHLSLSFCIYFFKQHVTTDL